MALSESTWLNRAQYCRPYKLFKKNSHMHQRHFANIFGENSLVCSIHSLPVLFLEAETIWRVVIRPCGGILPQQEQELDSLASETTCTVAD